MSAQPLPLINKYRLGWIFFWFLIILLVNATAVGLEQSIRGLDSSWMIPFGILSISLGWVLGGSQKRKGWLFLIGTLAGVVILLLFSSGAFTNLSKAIQQASIRVLPDLFGNQPTPPMETLIYYLYATASNFSNYFTEIARWLVDFLHNQDGFNPLIRDLTWGSLLWTVLFSAGWMFRRKIHAFLASLPALVVISGVLGYTRQNTLGLMLALGAILLLMVLQAQLIREDRWHKQKFDFSEEIRFDIIVLTIPVVLLILIVAGVIPNISFDAIREFYNEKIRNETSDQNDFAESLGLEQIPIEDFSAEPPSGMPRSHLIGTGPELSNIRVMDIDTGEAFLPPQVTPNTPLPKYYWRGRTYDIYTGVGWKTSQIVSESIPAGDPITIVKEEFEIIFSQTVNKSANASDTLFAAGIPVSVDQRITTGWRESTREYFSAYLPPRTYRVNSKILTVSKSALRGADEAAPPEILEGYLQLPEDIPERVTNLAQFITEEGAKPYEKAKLIEGYLRNFEYTLDLPPLPENHDVVDYFLFDLQRGYCDYYASAMVILSRASGLPARIAVGYATGTYDYTEQVFVVTEANAHAWPEVYIAPFGWVPFEPTASLSTFEWQSEDERLSFLATSTADTIEKMPTTPVWLNLLGIGGLLIVILLIGFLWYWIDHKKQKSTSTARQIEIIYCRMRTLLTQRFFTPQTALTPLEFRNDMIEYLNNRRTSKVIARLTQNMTQNLASLTSLYQQGIYTSQHLPSEEIKAAREHLRVIQTHSWVLSILFLFH